MQDSKRNNTWGDHENLCYYEYRGYCGINTLVRGEPILNNKYTLKSRTLEMRINIQNKLLKVSSLPNYDSVVKVDKPEAINPTIPYRIFL